MKMELEVKCTGRGRVGEIPWYNRLRASGSSSWSHLTNEARSPRFLHSTLSQAYQNGVTVDAVLEEVKRQVSLAGDNPIWIHLLSNEDLDLTLSACARLNPQLFPLYGIPFAIKDNIDLSGARTTAACEAFGYTPSESAFVVERLISAGAVPIGKTNLDQFATGLVGTRSPGALLEIRLIQVISPVGPAQAARFQLH